MLFLDKVLKLISSNYARLAELKALETSSKIASTSGKL